MLKLNFNLNEVSYYLLNDLKDKLISESGHSNFYTSSIHDAVNGCTLLKNAAKQKEISSLICLVDRIKNNYEQDGEIIDEVFNISDENHLIYNAYMLFNIYQERIFLIGKLDKSSLFEVTNLADGIYNAFVENINNLNQIYCFKNGSEYSSFFKL